ncbi:hypothetical protein [Fusibacter tunisiensis]|uniref:Type III secretion system FlhB-like substrate exporter n=1 Tax=Fusibacter tunisiensis TaxID=1008308 RepID=A0ABS2MSD3_9FIRM|nr:hypothetical protein [Fusibacter tunisiensis]MBM7562328.1 type III secretion system FlhB-like substrate exporter [Fusibacter tunisiensis]
MKTSKITQDYEHFDQNEDFSSMASQVIDKANANGLYVDQDPSRVKHMIHNDLRDVLPARVLELVGKIVSVIEDASDEEA